MIIERRENVFLSRERERLRERRDKTLAHRRTKKK